MRECSFVTFAKCGIYIHHAFGTGLVEILTILGAGHCRWLRALKGLYSLVVSRRCELIQTTTFPLISNQIIPEIEDPACTQLSTE